MYNRSRCCAERNWTIKWEWNSQRKKWKAKKNIVWKKETVLPIHNQSEWTASMLKNKNCTRVFTMTISSAHKCYYDFFFHIFYFDAYKRVFISLCIHTWMEWKSRVRIIQFHYSVRVLWKFLAFFLRLLGTFCLFFD